MTSDTYSRSAVGPSSLSFCMFLRCPSLSHAASRSLCFANSDARSYLQQRVIVVVVVVVVVVV